MKNKKIVSVLLLFVLLANLFSFSAFSETEKKNDNNKETESQSMTNEQYAKKLDETVYDKSDLGASYSKKSTTFKLWAPTAQDVKVNLYETGTDKEEKNANISSSSMQFDKKTGVWSLTKDGNYKNKYYTYTVTVDGKKNEVVDPYAKAAGANGDRAMIVDLSATNPEKWKEDKFSRVSNQTDAVIWEVHVRDFSSSESSGVSEENRGKYLAFTEKGTTVNGYKDEKSTCVDYLKELGVNYVQINPFYDYASVDETSKDDQYNWGYDPKNYNVPEGSYSSDPYDGNVRIKECKQMIQALHNAGIGVIMDVVYNHTYESENSWFNKIVPNYYYRMNEDGSFSNGSGCGNDTASERTMFRKFMVDSVTYWAKEYHIDGFRFDLMGLHDVDTMNAIRASLDELDDGKKILMYGEAWKLDTKCDEGTVLATQENVHLLNDRIAAFNDTLRDGLKGNVFDASDKGFIQEGKSKSDVKTGIEGQSGESGWANTPAQCVNYASCHDNLTLYDKLVTTQIDGDDKDYRKRYDDLVAQNKLSAAITLTSQGIPFFLAGEEFARSKDGDDNSFKSSTQLNALDWDSTKNYNDLILYYRGLIQIRKYFPGFTDSTDKTAKSIKYFENCKDSVIGYVLNNESNADKVSKAAVIFNGDPQKSVSVKIEDDNKKWVIVANNDTSGLRNLGEVTNGKVSVEPSSAVILFDKESYDKFSPLSDEGAVIQKFYDGKKLVYTDVILGKIGEKFDVSVSNSLLLRYDIKSVKGDTKGTFKSENQIIEYKCSEYKGKFSKVTITYLDENGKEIYGSHISTNREGQQYFTEVLPSIKRYNLNMAKLPKNGAGKFGDKDIKVEYHYMSIPVETNKQAGDVNAVDPCVLNVIYMDNNGKILDTYTKKGELDSSYSIEKKDFSGLKYLSATDELKGTFKGGEVNVILKYSDGKLTSTPNVSTTTVVVIVIAGVALLLVCGSVFLTVYKRKKNKAKSVSTDDGFEMEIED